MRSGPPQIQRRQSCVYVCEDEQVLCGCVSLSCRGDQQHGEAYTICTYDLRKVNYFT